MQEKLKKFNRETKAIIKIKVDKSKPSPKKASCE